MAAIDWLEIGGQKFSKAEARQASDFKEILDNFELEKDVVFGLFRDSVLPIPKRLVLTQIASLDDVAGMLPNEEDPRIIGVIQHRLREARKDGSSGVTH